MVVTRRTPAAPVPASRNPSSQPIPRLSKKATSDASSVPDKPSPLANGATPELAQLSIDEVMDRPAGTPSKSVKSRGKQQLKKSGKKKSRGSTNFAEYLFRIFLLWFTIYTLSVCPQDEELKSPVCRGLAEYRRLVIEPYIIPPIERAMAHPSVAPYVEKAKPYADYAIRTAKPIAVRAHKEFDARVVPQWNKRVVPLYYQYAVPQLLKLDAQIAPYRTRIEQEYERVLAPYVSRTAVALYQWQHQARPYVVLTARKTYEGYQVARPYARPVWEKVNAVLAQLAAILGEQRRQFVDPHVQKIWEHMKEMSNGKHEAVPASSLRSSGISKASSASAKISSTLSSVASSAISESPAISGSLAADNLLQTASSVISEVAPSSMASPVAQATDVVESSVVSTAEKLSSASVALKSSASGIPSSVSSSVSATVSAATTDIVSSGASAASGAESVAQASLEGASSVAQEIPPVVSSLAEGAAAAAHDTASEALSSVVMSVAHEPSSVASSANLNPSSVPEGASVTPDPEPAVAEVSGEEDPDLDFLSDLDLEAFKAEFGLEEDALLAAPEPEDSEPAEVHVETEEERETRQRERREKTIRDRASLEQRRTSWEQQINDKITANKKALRKALVMIRKAAVAELKSNSEIRDEIDGLIEDGEKFLRGAEKYLANLRKESRKLEEKRTLWDRVVGKVEEKFSDRLHQTEAIVNGWYNGVLDQELGELKRVTSEIKDLAERAQADIGLGYAYLDDVSYADWQLYHDLVRRSENFTAHAQSVQDGTHQSPPINPVVTVIKGLQDEVDDVISGFNARLRKIQRSGTRVFGSAEDIEEEEDESASILPIEKPEQTESPAETGVPPVAIGRSKEEVEAALNRVADLEGQKTSSPGEPEKVKNADAIAESLSAAVASEDASASSPSLHQEL